MASHPELFKPHKSESNITAMHRHRSRYWRAKESCPQKAEILLWGERGTKGAEKKTIQIGRLNSMLENDGENKADK